MLWYAISVLIVVLGALYAQKRHYEHLSAERVQADTAKLSDELVQKLSQVKEFESKLNHVLIKLGFTPVQSKPQAGVVTLAADVERK